MHIAQTCPASRFIYPHGVRRRHGTSLQGVSSDTAEEPRLSGGGRPHRNPRLHGVLTVRAGHPDALLDDPGFRRDLRGHHRRPAGPEARSRGLRGQGGDHIRLQEDRHRRQRGHRRPPRGPDGDQELRQLEPQGCEAQVVLPHRGRRGRGHEAHGQESRCRLHVRARDRVRTHPEGARGGARSR